VTIPEAGLKEREKDRKERNTERQKCRKDG
jgi:hypothetical protein